MDFWPERKHRLGGMFDPVTCLYFQNWNSSRKCPEQCYDSEETFRTLLSAVFRRRRNVGMHVRRSPGECFEDYTLAKVLRPFFIESVRLFNYHTSLSSMVYRGVG
jgi:hypothetical protein